MRRNLRVHSQGPLHLLALRPRVYRYLIGASYRTIGQVAELAESGSLVDICGIGHKYADEIKESLARVRIVDAPQGEVGSHTGFPPPRVTGVGTPADLEDVVEWQAGVIRGQVSMGMLHEEAKTAGKSISSWLADIHRVAPCVAYETLTSIIGGSIHVADELAFLLSGFSERDCRHVLVPRYGYEARTLDAIASSLAVSRERIRQIVAKMRREWGHMVQVALESSGPYECSLLRTQTGLLLGRDMGPSVTYEEWTNRCLSSGLIGQWTSNRYLNLDPIDTMIAVCHLLKDRPVEELRIPSNVDAAIQLALPQLK